MDFSVCSLLLAVLVVESLSPWRVTGQAPGDEDSFCLDISTAPAYAPTVKPLLDSWRYQTLLGPEGVWTAENFDHDEFGVRERERETNE